jgi:hypothetical protein
MLYGASRAVTRGPVFVALLVVVFLLSFSLPLFFTFTFRGAFGSAATAGPDADSLFPEYAPIQSAAQRIEVAHAPELNPTADKDFIISGWFKLARVLQSKEKVLLLAKDEGAAETQSGYIVGLSRDADTIRPIVYWGAQGKGKWYSFSDISLAAQSWFMLGLSFQEGKYLGLHIAFPTPDGKADVKLLGGYEIEAPSIPDSEGSLVVGAWGDGKFRLRVGPFGVFSRADIGDDLKSVFKSLARYPFDVPNNFSRSDVVLWAPHELKDEGPTQREIKFVSRKNSGR